jgi:hypothetical protein
MSALSVHFTSPAMGACHRPGAQQGGLADAVGADDGDALAGLDLQAQVLEQRLAVEALATFSRVTAWRCSFLSARSG